MQDGRISLPTRLRTLAGVSDGDPINVTLEQGRLIVTPAQRIGRAPSAKQQRAEFLSRLRADAPASLKAMWAHAKRKGTDKVSMREIDAIVAEVRAEQAAKHKTKQPAR